MLQRSTSNLKSPRQDYHTLTQQNRIQVQSMRLENTILSDQLVTQRQKITTEEVGLNVSLIKLQEECALYAQKIETETKRKVHRSQILKQDLEELLSRVKEQQIEQSRQENVNSGADLPKKQKRLKKQEIHLQQIHQKHNEQLADIQELKELLNVARRERVIYSTVFKGIERDAIEKQHEFLALIKRSEILKAELKQLMEILQNAQDLAQKEQNSFNFEYKRQFSVQGLTNEEASILQQSQMNRSASQPDIVHMTESYIGQDKQEFRHSGKQSTLSMEDASQQVKDFEQLFEKIYVETGIKSTDKILHAFLNQESIINETFQEITQISTMIDIKESELKEVLEKLEEDQKLGQQYKDRELQSKLKTSQHSTAKQIDHIQKNIDQIKLEIAQEQQTLVQIQDAVGVKVIDSDTNQWNLNQYQRDLEEKLNRVLTVSRQLERHDDMGDIQMHIQKTEMSEGLSMGNPRENISHKLDDILATMEKMPQSEKIISPEEMKKISLQTIIKKNLRKSKP